MFCSLAEEEGSQGIQGTDIAEITLQDLKRRAVMGETMLPLQGIFGLEICLTVYLRAH